MKVGCTAVVIRKHEKYGIQVHTQTRHVLNPEYDPLYDNTQETCAETIEKDGWENIIETGIRGCKEEMGTPNFVIKKIIGANGKKFSTRPEDEILGFQPYYIAQQLRGHRPFLNICFVVVAPEDFEPKLDKEGEVSAHKWWSPDDLLKELQENPSNFMGLHYPVLIQACKDIIDKKITI